MPKIENKEEILESVNIEEDMALIKRYFELIVKILKKYIDMEEDQYYAVASWIIASLFIDYFETFPILFINAQKRSGKSLNSNANIIISMPVNGTNKIIQKKIGEIIDNTISLSKNVKKDGEYEISSENPLNIKILQFNPQTFKLEWKEPKLFIRHPSPQTLLKIITRLGNDIIATKDHSFIIFENGNLCVKSGNDIKIGDVVLSIGNLPIEKEMSEYKGVKLTPELGYILGVYLAEGSSGECISTTNDTIKERLIECGKKIGININPYKNGKAVGISGNEKIKSLFNDFYSDDKKGKKYRKERNAKKIIPDFVLTANNEFKCSFLAGYFDGDGYIQYRKGHVRIECVSKSKRLIEGISFLLNTIGIPNKKWVKKHKTYGDFPSLTVISEGVKYFKEKIMPFMQNKLKKERIEKFKECKTSSLDSILNFGDILKRIREKLVKTNIGEISTDITVRSKNQQISKIKAKNLVEKIEKILEEKNVEPELTILKKFINTDMIFDRIIKIEEIPSDSKYVYDFSTEYENFVANNILVHNSRLLKLINQLIPDSIKVVSMTEASLFRLPKVRKVRAFLIDEAEDLGRREKANLRELINSAYKKGSKVLRVKKMQSGAYVIEEFDIYVPLAMANISGVDEVVEDKCITIGLERSKNLEIINRPELFDYDPDIIKAKAEVSVVSDMITIGRIYMDLCNYYMKDTIQYNNNYINNIYITNYYNTLTTLISKINESGISSRDLELWLPLLCVSWLAGEENFNKTLNFAVKEKKTREETEITEDRDSGLIVFLANFIKDKEENEFISVSDIVSEYKAIEPDVPKWFNSRWVGRALKRLKIVKSKRRMAKGVEVLLNFEKINQKAIDLGINLEEIGKARAFKKLLQPYFGKCAFCGKDTYLEWDISGSHACSECKKEEELRK